MPLSKECAVELCKTLTASVLCGGSLLARAVNPTAVVETALGATAIIATIAKDRSQEIDRIVERTAKQVEKESEVWVGARGPGAAGKREEALPAVQRAVLAFEPTGKEIATLGMDRDRVIAFYLERAAKSDPTFVPANGNEIARELLSDVVGYTFDIVRHAPEMQSHALEEILRRQDQMPDAVAAKVVDALESKILQGAEQRGLDRGAIVALAKRLKPEENLSFDQAVKELEHAVEIALDLIAGGKQGSNLGAFIDTILKRIGEETQAQQFDRAAAEVDSGLREIALREEEQKDDNLRARVAVIESGIKVDILRRDAESVANRVEALIGFQTDARPCSWTPKFREVRDRYQTEGREKGTNFSLEIAIALATRMLWDAATPKQRGDARNLLGNALGTLGERESGTARLEEAVAVYRDALKEPTRDTLPFQWAGTQNNLGSVLAIVGERESGTTRLEEAVAAFRDALKEWTRETTPRQWAMTQNNLGSALGTLGERESGTARLEEAVTAFRDALKERTRVKFPHQWAMTQNNLGNALRILGERESSLARLEESVVAYRDALKEFTRDKAPLDWAMTQNNLGGALVILGDRESKIVHLEEAVAAFRDALKEWTPEKTPYFCDRAAKNLAQAQALLTKHHPTV